MVSAYLKVPENMGLQKSQGGGGDLFDNWPMDYVIMHTIQITDQIEMHNSINTYHNQACPVSTNCTDQSKNGEDKDESSMGQK